MTVVVNAPLRAKTLLDRGDGHPYHVNAALVSPYVVNVFPKIVHHTLTATSRPHAAGRPAPSREGPSPCVPAAQRPGRSRRGVTLVEMLVTVALLVLMMTIIVQIFRRPPGRCRASRAYQELDQDLRRLDSTIRQDLNGVTARMTPPLDPKENLGYFEYGENAFADLQGEDTDDYLRFTAKAPEGQPFTGREWHRSAGTLDRRPADPDHQPVCRGHLLPPQRQPLSPRPPHRPRAAVVALLRRRHRSDGQLWPYSVASPSAGKE